ncbi:unnamed protein product [Microthlaspi erraticum]|uniref:RING-type E3 ubiquitin transferase n=1 Tax=Microthlaspi erraticum TaxID=1685480 RepID=A0A6D2HY33_9BRAS|nr:unnamed protein product [Microthlaspi erraticum]
MARETISEQTLAGEASSSSRKRQRLNSIVGEEVVEEEIEEEEEEEVITEVRSGTMSDLDLLECPVCCNALTAPIFQCDNGHIACSSCCVNLRHKCPACTLPIGNYRCRIMERVVEAIIVPCPNAIHGCSEKFSYGKELVHEKQCGFSCGHIDDDVFLFLQECSDGNQNVDSDEVVAEARSGTMFELDLLDCPVCFKALTAPIYQCDNGHIACSSCCVDVRHKCSACTLPIGNYRCRIMERVVEAIIVPCPNTKHGCPEKFSYGEELVHEKQCGFALCHCPERSCKYAGVYKDLYLHYNDNHRDGWNIFACGLAIQAWMHTCDKILVLQETRAGALVTVQCFEEPNGMFVSVNCIAPSAPGVGEFAYVLSYSDGGKTVSFEMSEMNRIRKVSFQNPEDYMSIPDHCMLFRDSLKMKICIRRRGEKKKEGDEN